MVNEIEVSGLMGVKLNRLRDGFWYISYKKLNGTGRWINDSRHKEFDTAISRVWKLKELA